MRKQEHVSNITSIESRNERKEESKGYDPEEIFGEAFEGRLDDPKEGDSRSSEEFSMRYEGPHEESKD